MRGAASSPWLMTLPGPASSSSAAIRSAVVTIWPLVIRSNSDPPPSNSKRRESPSPTTPSDGRPASASPPSASCEAPTPTTGSEMSGVVGVAGAAPLMIRGSVEPRMASWCSARSSTARGAERVGRLLGGRRCGEAVRDAPVVECDVVGEDGLLVSAATGQVDLDRVLRRAERDDRRLCRRAVEATADQLERVGAGAAGEHDAVGDADGAVRAVDRDRVVAALPVELDPLEAEERGREDLGAVHGHVEDRRVARVARDDDDVVDSVAARDLQHGCGGEGGADTPDLPGAAALRADDQQVGRARIRALVLGRVVADVEDLGDERVRQVTPVERPRDIRCRVERAEDPDRSADEQDVGLARRAGNELDRLVVRVEEVLRDQCPCARRPGRA